MYNWDSPWEECAFVVTLSTCDNWSTSRFPCCVGLDVRSLSESRRQLPAEGLVFGVLVLFDERNTSVTASHKSMATNPSIHKPASNEIISNSVELWDTDVLFLAHPTNRNKCSTSKDTQDSHPRLILNPHSHQQNLSLGINPIDNAAPYHPHGNIVCDHSCDECTRAREPCVRHKLWSILVQHEQICSRTIKYRVYQCGPNTEHFRTTWEHTFDTSPTEPKSSSLNWWSWASRRSSNVENPGKIFHSNSIGSPSIVSNVLYCDESFNCRSQTVFVVGFWFIFPRHNTESENT